MGSPALSILLANSARASVDRGFAALVRLILPSFRLNGPRREFASSITLGAILDACRPRFLLKSREYAPAGRSWIDVPDATPRAMVPWGAIGGYTGTPTITGAIRCRTVILRPRIQRRSAEFARPLCSDDPGARPR